MASFNRVVLLGNITRDIEVKTLQSGTSVAEIGLAVNERHKDNSGNWVEETSFFDCVLWGRNAEVVGEYLQKGSPLLLEGRLKQDTWEQDGQKRSKVKVIAEKVQLLPNGKNALPDEMGQRETTPRKLPPKPQAKREPQPFAGPPPLADVPF